MDILWIILLIIAIIIVLVGILLLGTYITYLMVFYAPKRIKDTAYSMPQGEQYEKRREGIAKSINEMLARPFEPVTIISHDGKKLYARYYHVADNAPVQIQFHGYKSSALLDFCGGSKLAGKIGHNALVVDQRSHGKSEGKAITFGIEERKDCMAWINYVRSRFGNDVKIILFGLSMGAATVLMSADLHLPDNVVGIIADCPFSVPKDIIKKVARDLYLPATILYPFIKLAARLFAHFDLEESSAITAVSKTNLPILLIHGEADNFVPCDMSREIHAVAASHSSLITIPDAGHGLCYMVAPEKYEEAVIEFLNKVLNM
ncbi:MAG: alpha/beta hydrolase [Lachnospiraceae bacterium]|nr:alpha/beta hydrolase [Lachnospiraceae bacterium]